MYSIILISLSLISAVFISPKVENDLSNGGLIPVLVQLDQLTVQPRFSSLSNSAGHKTSNLKELREFSNNSRKTISKKLESLVGSGDITYVKSYYISNTISVVGSKRAIEEISTWENVKEISSNRPFTTKPTSADSTTEIYPPELDQPHWSLNFINVTNLSPKIFEDAKNLVYANAGTGVQFNHQALEKNYKGNLGNYTYDHNYSWFDAIKTPIFNGTRGRCKLDSIEPCDDGYHGTHTMSTAVGIKNLGVSPKTPWIACKNMDRTLGSPESFLSCFQFLLAPTDLNGNNPRPELRPHVVGNSYVCPESEMCSTSTFTAALKVLKDAGVFMVFSAGNEGRKGCGTIDSVLAKEPISFVVAASQHNSYERTELSSVGPVKERDHAIDVTAPGSFIFGAMPGDMYSIRDGTSMAVPHVTGAALLIMAACPSLQRQVDRIQDLLRQSATPVHAKLGCGSDTNQTIPNNEFGYGVINVAKAIEICQKDEA